MTKDGARRQHVPDAYVRRVEEAGGFPILFPTADPAFAPDAVALVDGLLLVGGDDVDPALYGAARPDLCEGVDRERDDFEAAVVREAVSKGVPTLGVCRGLQVMNVALGGTLLEDLPTRVPDAGLHRIPEEGTHPVRVEAGSRLHALLAAAALETNSHHHQAIDRPAARLAVVARSADGVVEAAEDPAHPFLVGVQWHPERMAGADATARLFRGLVRAASARAAGEARGAATPAAPLRP
jgi:putative glutamine amidotransferase